jgi:nitrogen fixation-related uncharacterized protein
MLEKTERAIDNGQYRDTDNIGNKIQNEDNQKKNTENSKGEHD